MLTVDYNNISNIPIHDYPRIYIYTEYSEFMMHDRKFLFMCNPRYEFFQSNFQKHMTSEFFTSFSFAMDFSL